MTNEEHIEQLKKLRSFHNGSYGRSINKAIEALKQEPKTGHWSHDGSHWKNRFICSECNYKLFDEPTNYCPNCGAKMESEERNDTDNSKAV